jgi:putative ABC transport system substrate-binding protein
MLLKALAGFSVWPALAAAQAKIPIIGALGPGNEAVYGKWYAAMVARLEELGWVDGHNVKILYRWAGGNFERASAIAAEFAQLKVDVIVTTTNGVISRAMKAAPETPIVATGINGDPVVAGFVQTFAHPGGNVTGLSAQLFDLAPKRIQLLREIVPNLKRLAVMVYRTVERQPELQAAEAYGATQGLEVTVALLEQPGDIAPTFNSLKGRVDGVYVPGDPFTADNQAEIFAAAVSAHLPSVTNYKEYAASGALLSYGPSPYFQFRRAGDFVDRILRGEKPGDLPIQQPTRFELVVNLKTAKALDLTIPNIILAAVDEAIE